MRTSVIAALFLMLILSFRPIKENKICTHCDFARMYEPKVDLNPKQPKEYIHKDSLFIINKNGNAPHDPRYKVWNSMSNLKVYIDSLFNTGSLTKDSIIKGIGKTPADGKNILQ